MEIHSVILFVSSASQACYRLINLCKENELPVRFVRLDTQQQRRIASSGTRFQILGVPSLVIQFEDGNTQMFAGEIKATEWIRNFLNNREEPEPVETVVDFEPKKGRQKSRRRVKPVVSRPKFKETTMIDFSDDSEEDDSEEEFELMESVEIQPPAKPNTDSLMVGKKGKDSNMGDILAIAKNMERARKDALPYDEKNIPSGI